MTSEPARYVHHYLLRKPSPTIPYAYSVAYGLRAVSASPWYQSCRKQRKIQLFRCVESSAAIAKPWACGRGRTRRWWSPRAMRDRQAQVEMPQRRHEFGSVVPRTTYMWTFTTMAVKVFFECLCDSSQPLRICLSSLA